MSISRSKKKLIVIIGSIVGVLGILAVVYFLNMDAINNWFRLKTMSDEEYADMVTDRFVDILEDRLFAPAQYVPDLSDGAELKAYCSLDESVAGLLGIPTKIVVVSTGTAVKDDGKLGLSLNPYIEKESGSSVRLTAIDATLDLPQKRLYVRIPEFDKSTLELTSLYDKSLKSALSDIAPIIDVDKLLGSLTDTFTGVSEPGGLFERLRNDEKSRELTREEIFWGIGLKEGKECDITASIYDFAGFEVYVRVFSDADARILGSEIKINTGKNRLGFMFDLTPERDAESEDTESENGQSPILYEASLDGLKLFNGTITTSVEDGTGAKTVIKAEPGKLIKSLFNGDDVSITVTVRSKNGYTVFDILADMGGGKVSQIELYLNKLNVTKPEILGTGEVTDISKLNIADYGDVGKLAEFAVEKVEELDLQILRDYIDAYIKKYVNAAAGYEMLKEFHASGMLSRVVSVLVGGNISGNLILGPGTRPAGGNTGSAQAEGGEGASAEGAQVGNGDQTDAAGAEGAQVGNGDQTDAAGADAGAQTGGTDAADTSESGAGKEGADLGDAATGAGKEGTAGSGQGKADGTLPEGENTGDPEKKVTPEELERLKAEFLAKYKYSYKIETDDPKADWGDEIVMDIVPLLMGAPYPGMEYKDACAYLGEQWYGEGLDEKVIGAKVGDVIDVEATLGDDFGAFSGYKGKFRVTIKVINKYVRPEWTESFIVDRLGYASLEECEKKLIASLD